MKKLNKKGFTLVELLAVIVVLALLMVVATSSVGNALNNAKKNTLKTETQKIVTGIYQEGQSAYMLNSSDLTQNIVTVAATANGINSKTKATAASCKFKTGTSESTCTANGGVWLAVGNYYLKGKDGDYTYGVVLDAAGNVKGFAVNYKSEYNIISNTAMNGNPKIPDNILVNTGSTTL